MAAYYNEIDPYAAQWLRNLIGAGHIAGGEVDERDIRDVRPSDLHGFHQCHFFAGIGGWSLALRLAGWSDDRPVWTGSCPCQPFSVAGKGKGFGDERHLWPDWFALIRECSPAIIFGEQVASKDALDWLDTVSDGLEDEGYATGAADLCASCVGAPHIRQRLFWVGHTVSARLERHVWYGPTAEGRKAATGSATKTSIPSMWGGADILQFTDGKIRPVEPGSFPLAHGVPARVGRLRAFGNAIVPQVAAEFIKANME